MENMIKPDDDVDAVGVATSSLEEFYQGWHASEDMIKAFRSHDKKMLQLSAMLRRKAANPRIFWCLLKEELAMRFPRRDPTTTRYQTRELMIGC